MNKKLVKKKRIFKKISGNIEKPRLSIFRSNKHFYAQLIDDINQKTFLSFSTLKLNLEKEKKFNLNCSITIKVGLGLAEEMKKKSIKHIVFDKNGKPYHGKIKCFAESLRQNGIKF